MRSLIFFFVFIGFGITTLAQEVSQESDTTKMLMNMDAVYTRPFLQIGKTPVAVGGYVEANTSYFSTDGISEGLSFQMRRLTLFVSSTISNRVKFLSELEFEDGTKEINIEFAAIDFEFHPLFNLRGGVIMNPIGAFNQNHDGPKWEFIDRPIMATEMLPATWSNVGFGFHGKKYTRNFVWAYETYLTNGFDDRIISNQENKTFLPATKLNRDRFEESFNGAPLLTSKIAVRHRKIGELGLSHMGGVYNKFQEDGIILDKKRRVDVWALDFNSTLPAQTYLAGEIAFVNIDVPETYTQQFGSAQMGAYFDIVQPVRKGKFLVWDNTVFNVVLRTEYVDWNKDSFQETGETIADEIITVVPGISFRPSNQTVIRFNYRYHWQKDLLGNPPAKTGGFQFGISSYF
ncbi:MAG: hypothetical protein RIA63_10560 [Cyclobacteriaceae bacterium]